MTEIRIQPEREDVYVVEVHDQGSRTEHRVVVTDEDLERFAWGTSAAALLEESFRFLLEREPKESILRRFELPVIAHYFPEYPREIRRRLTSAGDS